MWEGKNTTTTKRETWKNHHWVSLCALYSTVVSNQMWLLTRLRNNTSTFVNCHYCILHHRQYGRRQKNTYQKTKYSFQWNHFCCAHTQTPSPHGMAVTCRMTDHPPIDWRLLVQYQTSPLCMSKCPWARGWAQRSPPTASAKWLKCTVRSKDKGWK